MTIELVDCPNCGTKLKSGILSSTKLLNDNKTKIINEYHTTKAEAYCSKCGDNLYTDYENQLKVERKKIGNQIHNIIDTIPVISIHTPLNWDYEILQMVTGQSTTGTGVISEFSSSFTDLFGLQSDRYNKKLKAGENICFTQLRKQTLDIGGNAVIATDIDYSEVGGEKGMLMVCMAGTAIKLKNTSVFGQDKVNKIEELVTLNERLKALSVYEITESD
jgi:uncharacterized protein YbjQ (UPF0145 family)